MPMMAVALFVAMVAIMVVPVVSAPFRLAGQLAVQVGRDQCFHRLIGKPGHDVDALLGKERQGSLTNAPGDDEFNPLALQPAGKRTGDMFGRRQRLGAEGRLGARGPPRSAQSGGCRRNANSGGRFQQE